MELTEKLSELMNFDYEFSSPKSGKYGKRLPNGKWDGLVGDLARGVSKSLFSLSIQNHFRCCFNLQETEIAIGALTMTSEREEIIDFVSPYFHQTGISISSFNKNFFLFFFLNFPEFSFSFLLLKFQ